MLSLKRTVIICILAVGAMGVNATSTWQTAGTSSFHRPVVIVGPWHMPPYFYTDAHGKPDGFCIDLLTTILKRKNIPYVIHVENWNKSLSDLKSGRADISCLMFTSIFEKNFLFGASTIYVPMYAIYRTGQRPVSSITDLNGKTLLTVNATLSVDLLRENNIKIKNITGKNTTSNFLRLSKGEGDAILCNSATARYLINKYSLTNLDCNEIDMAPQENRLAGNNEKLLEIMGQELHQMRIDGTYDKICNKWVQMYEPSKLPLYIYLIVCALLLLAILLYLIIIYLRRRIQSGEKKRTELLKKYKIIFDNALIGIQYFNEMGILVDANDTACQHFNVTDKKQMLNAHLCLYDQSIIGEHVNQQHPEPFSGVIKCDFSKLDPKPYIKTTTDIKYIETNMNPLYDADGKLMCIIVTNKDVSDMITAQKELRIETEKAQSADRLKSEFLANMSHEIRTPLNAIVGFTDLLRSSDTTEEKNVCFEQIDNNSHILVNLINDILNMSKIETGTVEINETEINLSEMFRQMYVSLNNLKIKQNIDFICHSQYRHCIVYADREFIRQVTTNFVTNAFKYTESGYVKMSFETVDDGIKIIVEDTGEGIPEDKVDKIFTRFEKIGSMKQGTGLGLAICKSIVDLCKGKIGVTSTVGKGSTFWAWFPCKILICE
jgi:ABC-type amino acid transport substrate-binding protein/nitrogen-specific signal transduction histidine kinase